VLLMRETRLAEMNLTVDHAGQNMQAVRIQHLSRRSGAEIADRCDLAGCDGDVPPANPVVIDNGCIFYNEIKCLRHMSPPCRQPADRSGYADGGIRACPIASAMSVARLACLLADLRRAISPVLFACSNGLDRPQHQGRRAPVSEINCQDV